MPIVSIREIIEFGGLTEVPLMPDFLRGVINLRGSVVPVIDLSVRFGRAPTVEAKRTCIIIMELVQDEQMLLLGVMVDAVSAVLSIGVDHIEPRPSFGAGIRADFIEGMINVSERFIVVLDVQRVLSVDELASLLGMSAETRWAACQATACGSSDHERLERHSHRGRGQRPGHAAVPAVVQAAYRPAPAAVEEGPAAKPPGRACTNWAAPAGQYHASSQANRVPRSASAPSTSSPPTKPISSASRVISISWPRNCCRSGASQKHLRVWSAASATGEEAYTLAMLLDQSPPPQLVGVRLRHQHAGAAFRAPRTLSHGARTEHPAPVPAPLLPARYRGIRGPFPGAGRPARKVEFAQRNLTALHELTMGCTT
jgi:purine-binding chemotaxis protein CheW